MPNISTVENQHVVKITKLRMYGFDIVICDGNEHALLII